MGPFEIMLKNVLLFVALAIPGYVFVKKGIVKPEQSGVLSKILLYIGVPLMVMTSTMNVGLTSDVALGILAVLGLGIGVILLMFVLSKPLWKHQTDEKKQGMLRFCSIFSNNGFLGIPLANAVFGAGATATLYLVVLNILSNVAMYTLGIYLIAADKKAMNFKKALVSPVVIGFVAGLACNLLSVKTAVPEVYSYANYFYNVVTPISMMILGMKFGEIPMSALFKNKKMYVVAACKLLAMPVLVMTISLLLRTLVGLSTDMVLAAFVAFATPTAALASTFSDNHNGDTEGAVIYTLGTTVLCVVSVPILYALVCMIL